MSHTGADTMLMLVCGVLCQSFCLLVRQLPTCMKQESISPYSQNSIIGSYPELAESAYLFI